MYGKLSVAAVEARKKAYAPYSDFKVGAALLTADGKIYSGCNIENSAFSPTVCAERVALFKAISEGERDFVAIAVAGGKERIAPTMPCGVCRQALAEFCNGDLKVITDLDESGNYTETTLGALLPNAFSKADFRG